MRSHILETRRYRWGSWLFGCGVVGAVFSLLYSHTLAWGWLDFDDKALVIDNPHLGAWSWENVRWALTDTAFGRRWTPLMWLVAEIPWSKTAPQFHWLVFCLGALLSVLVFVWFARSFDYWYALFLSLFFVCSPLRMEVFGWTMGFVYLSTAICCVASFICVSDLGAILWAVGALLCYPQAAGVFLLVVWFRRSSRLSWFFLGLFVAYTVFQYNLRLHIGFIPMHYRWLTWPWTIFHYVLMLAFPFVTSPVFPAGYYPLLAVGALLCAVWLAVSWRSFCVCVVVLAPVLAASVTESFWFGARYSVLFTLAVLFFFGLHATRRRSYRALWGLAIACALSGSLAYGNTVFSVGNIECLGQTVNQAETLGADCLVYKIVIGRLTGADRRLIMQRPELAKYLDHYVSKTR